MTDPIQEAARHYAARDLAATEAVCRAILTGQPNHFDAAHLLGVVLTLANRPAEALPHLRHALLGMPTHPLLRANLGNALLALHQYREAIEISGLPDPAVLNNRGLGHMGLKHYREAEQAFRQATALQPDHAPAWANLGNALVRQDRLEEALIAHRTALHAAPGAPVDRLAGVVNEAGRTLLALGRAEEALAECRDFLARYPGERSVRWNMSLALLLLGRFDEGWQAYENRFDLPDHDPRPAGSTVLDPRQVAGKRVLILTEQGRGDMLQFIRYAPLLAERGAEVWVWAYPDLVALLSATPGVTGVVSTDEPRPEADLCTPVMSLPLAFGTHPANVPYLRVPPGRHTNLGPRTQPRIGIAWSGSTHSYDRSAMPVATLAPLFALPGLEFHVLQPDCVAGDRAWLESARPPIHWHALRDFADTAALIDAMDRIISIDTAVAHLAGALGKPVSLLLPFNPDWRWQLGRGDSPWYPTARLYRQPQRGDWQSVVDAVVQTFPASD